MSVDQAPYTRKITGREMAGVIAEFLTDAKATVAAHRNAGAEQITRRDELAAHLDHRVELRTADGTVTARGVVTFVTAMGVHLTHVEAGAAFTRLGDVAGVVRLAALAIGFTPGERVLVGDDAGKVLFTSPGKVTVALPDGSRVTVPSALVTRTGQDGEA
ncbi:hypothetical protein ACFHW2_11550 [Actinomadura sp. LOL_016]|uniref:hypothetical protein n=1 Tax=unclassified Actinomadura TaxID=2626254 RepID=UPI003A8106DF